MGKIQWNIITWKIFFYSHLSVEDITYAGCTHEKIVYKDFKIKKLGEYHDLYFQSDKLLIANVFENFWNICLEI